MKKLIGLLVMVCLFAACEVSDDYSVEGVIKQNGSALANVQVELQREYGAVIATGTTNYRGVYSIATVYGGPYHVVPAKDGYYFTPAYVAVNLDDYPPHVSGVDFTANVLNRVSGHVYQGRTALEGIAVTLDGRENLTTLTDAQGYYEFILDFQGTVTVSVS